MRLARSGMGAVDYWMGLPIDEVLQYMNELIEQLRAEQKPP